MHAQFFRHNIWDVVVIFHVLVIFKKHIRAILVIDIFFDHALLAEAGVGRVQNTHLATRVILRLTAVAELGDGFVHLVGLIHHLNNLRLLLHDPVLHNLAIHLQLFIFVC